jgi:hypothetical protein
MDVHVEQTTTGVRRHVPGRGSFRQRRGSADLQLPRPDEPAVERQCQRDHQRRAVRAMPGRVEHRQRSADPAVRLPRTSQPAVQTRVPRRSHQPAAHDDPAAGWHVRSSVVVPVVVDGRAGAAEVGVGVAEGLHPRAVQRPAVGLRDDARHGYDVGLDEFRSLLELEPDGVGVAEPDAVRCGRAVVVLLRAA